LYFFNLFSVYFQRETFGQIVLRQICDEIAESVNVNYLRFGFLSEISRGLLSSTRTKSRK
jgi:hypothetical protein